MRRLKAPEKLTWKSFRWGMLVCHQAILIKRTLADPYDLKYKFSADYDWVLKALKKSENIVNSGLTLVRYLQDGLTRENVPAGLKERFGIMVRSYGFLPTVFTHFLIAARFLFYLLRFRRF